MLGAMRFLIEPMEEEQEFICPECESKESGFGEMLSMYGPTSNQANEDPWSSVLQQTECSSCNSIIPNHIAYRWENLNIEEAKEQWNKLYKKNNQLRKFE